MPGDQLRIETTLVQRVRHMGKAKGVISVDGKVASPETLAALFGAIDRLLAMGADAESALYLLPNAFPIRFDESGDLLSLHHKWTTRLCLTAQEEIWRASRNEVSAVAEIHPAIARWLGTPCTLRRRAGLTPFCPEGPRFCGVRAWSQDISGIRRIV